MISAALFLLAARPAEALPSAEETARQVAACGFSPGSLTVRDDPLLEEDVVIVRAAGPPPDESRLACAARASLAASVIVEFEPERVHRLYLRAYSAAMRARDLAEARAWLADRGLLVRLPEWNGKRGDLAVAGGAIERLCGLEPGSRLIRRRGILTVRTDVIDGGRLSPDDFLCLTRAAEAAGLPLGFIGREVKAPVGRHRPRRGVAHAAG
ncbi:MAG: hypothetical protein QOJ94_1231 [Sphingomonadales bacterium]|jgi:hypothetical protein|nr:hypothetical protein [Sphingomonadales bacterium]